MTVGREPVVLLTGFTGLVGGELLRRLPAARPGHRFVLVTRQPDRAARFRDGPGTRALAGDLQRPDWAGAARAELEGDVIEILHCAADTRFGLPIGEARAGNVGTTRNVLDFARRCRRLRKFSHASTVYVAGRTAGTLPEAACRHANGFCNTYQQAKYETEEIVLASGLPAAVFRLSSIIGDSTTGAVRQFNYVHSLLRLFPRNVLPVVPLDPGAPMDFIASDWAAAALLHLSGAAFVPGRVYQVCAGAGQSLTAGEMIDRTVEAFRESGHRRTIRMPRFVGLAEYEEFASARRREGDRLLNELLRILGYSLPHLAIRQAFENRHAVEGLAGSGIELPPIREYYGRVVRYCITTAWGRDAPT